jgi:hypothetical protein
MRSPSNVVLLDEPGCDIGCPVCPRPCAVAQIIMKWWLMEETRLIRAGVPTEHEDRIEAAEHISRCHQTISQHSSIEERGRALRKRPILRVIDGGRSHVEMVH